MATQVVSQSIDAGVLPPRYVTFSHSLVGAGNAFCEADSWAGSSAEPRFQLVGISDSAVTFEWLNSQSCAGGVELTCTVHRGASSTTGLPDGWVNVADLGISPDNTAEENSDAIDAAMLAIDLDDNDRPAGQHWIWGAGRYQLAREVHIDRSMRWQGCTGGAYASTELEFPTNSEGIIIHHITGPGSLDYEWPAPNQARTGNGGWTHISDMILFTPGASSDDTADGITIYGYNVTIERVVCYSFSGSGFHVEASGSGDRNADSWRLIDCGANFNGQHGLHTNGGNANAGMAIGFQASSNDGWGVYERSFLGNWYESPQTLANALGGYNAAGAGTESQRNMFMNPYSEGDETASYIDSPNMVFGGLIPAGIVGNYAGLVGGSANNPILFAATGGGQVQIGTLDGSKAFLKLWRTGDTLPLQLKANQTTNPFSGCYEWNYADLSGGSRFALAGENAQLTASYHCAIDPAMPIAPDGVIIGGRKRFFSAATPTTGTFNRGDKFDYTAPTSGGFEGEVCVASGTAGTYSEGKTATTAGTNQVTLNAASAVLKVGDCLTINATDVRIQSIAGAVLTVEAIEDGSSTTIAAAGPGLAVAYKAPVWKTFGNIS